MIFLTGAITEFIDVAQVALYVFWLFFAALIYYLQREATREGHPLIKEHGQSGTAKGLASLVRPKTFILPHGMGTVTVPRLETDQSRINARATAPFSGAPLYPTGDAMQSGIGPGAYAARANRADVTYDGHPRIVPLRVAGDFAISSDDPDPRGMPVIGGDGMSAGTVRDVWVDRAESLIRYYEVGVGGAGPAEKRVLLPVNFANVSRSRNEVLVDAIYARHFAAVPALASPDTVTRLEEERVCAYYGSGLLYADPKRTESLL